MDSFGQEVFSVLKICAMASLLFSCSSEEPEQPLSLLESYLLDTEALARGRSLFAGSCANYCHGDAPKPGEDVDLFDCRWQHGGTDEDIFRIVTTGIPETRMVGFGNNFPQGQNDLWKLIAYIRSEQADCGP